MFYELSDRVTEIKIQYYLGHGYYQTKHLSWKFSSIFLFYLLGCHLISLVLDNNVNGE